MEFFLNPKEIALERYKTIEPFLQRRATLEEISKQTKVAVRTLYRWVTAFKLRGLNGITPKARTDKGQHRSASAEVRDLAQGLYLRTPPVPITAIYRSVTETCKRNGWRVPSYDVVHEVVSEIPPQLKTLAHEGVKAYKQAFGLLHRFEAERANEIWQADHTPLDIFVLDSNKQPSKPWLTAIVDDYSRAVPGYFLGFQPPSSMRIALALRQAIWHKDEDNWTVCGIPEKFYSDCGSDFMSNHIDQVSIDLNFETIQTEPGEPGGKGKCERFFLTVNEMLLATLPGYAPEGHGDVAAVLTLEQLAERFKNWLLNEYMIRKHSETGVPPKERWQTFPFVPRLPDSLEQLDLLLLTVTRTRRVRRDGIRFSGFRYFDVSLNGYVGEDVTIRFDPRDLGEIYVYLDNTLICKASCFELSGKSVSLKDVRQARNHETKVQKNRLNELLATAEKHAPVPRFPIESAPSTAPPTQDYPKIKIRRFACDMDRESKPVSDDKPVS
jgi:putative transposase